MMSKDKTKTESVGKIATTHFRVRGSIHSSGEAYVNVKRFHTDESGDPPISVKGSLNKTGIDEITIENQNKFGNIQPKPSEDVSGFSSIVQSELSFRGEVHSGSNLEVEIEELVVIPMDRPDIMVALDSVGYDVYDEVNIAGSVHETGQANVTIKDLYDYPENF